MVGYGGEVWDYPRQQGGWQVRVVPFLGIALAVQGLQLNSKIHLLLATIKTFFNFGIFIL